MCLYHAQHLPKARKLSASSSAIADYHLLAVTNPLPAGNSEQLFFVANLSYRPQLPPTIPRLKFHQMSPVYLLVHQVLYRYLPLLFKLLASSAVILDRGILTLSSSTLNNRLNTRYKIAGLLRSSGKSLNI